MSTAESTRAGDGLRLLRGVRGLVRRFSISERADVQCCGLTVAQGATLEILREEGAMRLGVLGGRLGIAPSTLTRNVARLAASGLVSLASDPDDLRVQRVELTAAGRRAAARVAGQEEAFAEAVLQALPEGDREKVLSSLLALLGAVREATEHCCPGAFDHLMKDFPSDGRKGQGSGQEPCCR